MELSWNREPAPTWDPAKQQVLGDLPVEVLGLRGVSPGQRLADEWWRVEASNRGLNYVYNVVHSEHPDHDEVRAWFLGRGFSPGTDDELRKQLT